MRKSVALLSGLWLLVGAQAQAESLPPIQTVFVILMENYGWSRIEGSTNAPFINNVLLPQAAYCEQYYTASNFNCSLLSYLWLEAGTAFGLQTTDMNCDADPIVNHQSTTNHLVSLLERAGIAWKTYQEDIPGNAVPLSGYGNYAVRHNPFAYFDDITGTNNPADPYGIAHNRPYGELAGDLAGNTVARYNFITPNLCDDMHDGCLPLANPILQGDTWLSQAVPKLMASAAYTNSGAIFITWDDPGPEREPIGMIVLSPLTRGHGYRSYTPYNHSSTLRTFQDIFGVSPLLGDAANAMNLGELFVQPTNPPPLGLAIDSLRKLTTGALELSARGLAANQPLVLESSPDLSVWLPLSSNWPAASTWTTTLNPAPASRGFYRLKQVLP